MRCPVNWKLAPTQSWALWPVTLEKEFGDSTELEPVYLPIPLAYGFRALESCHCFHSPGAHLTLSPAQVTTVTCLVITTRASALMSQLERELHSSPWE